MFKWSNSKTEKFKLSPEAADAQVHEILEYYHLSVDEIEEESARKAFESSLNKISTAFRRGELEIKHADKGRFQIVQHLTNAPGDVKELVYDELQGKYKTEMDGFKAEDSYKRQYALLGALSGVGKKAIEALRGSDMSTAECLGFLFLMV